jgi:hypothetical protein
MRTTCSFIKVRGPRRQSSGRTPKRGRAKTFEPPDGGQLVRCTRHVSTVRIITRIATIGLPRRDCSGAPIGPRLRRCRLKQGIFGSNRRPYPNRVILHKVKALEWTADERQVDELYRIVAQIGLIVSPLSVAEGVNYFKYAGYACA